MGKPRKIVIDDTIPCNREGDSLFPKCNNFDEFWPSILTKAILKLFSFKYKSSIFSKKVTGDIQIFYSLTGYIPELINFENLKRNSKKENILTNNDLLRKYIINHIQDDNFFHKKNFLMVYYNSYEEEDSTLEKNLFRKSINYKIKLGVPKKILFLESSIKKIAFGSNSQHPKKLQSK